LAAGDFNDDGRLDLAAANPAMKGISVYLGQGNGMFQLPKRISTTLSPIALTTGDFRGDGHLDIAALTVVDPQNVDPQEPSSTARLAVLLGNGDGTFQTPGIQFLPFRSVQLITGDFNEDGRLDLATANGGSTGISVLQGSGDGSFVTGPAGPPLGDNPQAIVTGDFTGDGVPDFATANAGSDNVTVHFGRGDGQFFGEGDYSVGHQPVSLAVGDFNGDGRLDLATADKGAGTVSILLGLGDGTFAPAMHFPAGSQPVALVTGYFDGDKHLDLAVLDQGSGTVALLRGRDDGTFEAPVSFRVGSKPSSLVTGDFNRDGHLDLAVANAGSASVSVLLGRGDGTFRPEQQFPAGDNPHSIVAADFDRNGQLDLAVINPASDAKPGTVSVLMGNGDGTFRKPNILKQETGLNGDVLVTGDFTGEGYPDLITAGDFTGEGSPDLTTPSAEMGLIFKGSGHGTFQPPIEITGLMKPQAAVPVNFSTNGALGLLFAIQNDRAQYLENQGDGTFLPPVASFTPRRSTPLFADFEGNGSRDSIIVDATGTILFRKSRGAGRFDPPVKLNPKVPVRDAALVTDAQGTRIAAINRNADSLSLFTRQSDGTFSMTSPPGLRTGLLPSQIASGDVNGDGRADLVVLNVGGLQWTLSIFLGKADGSFTKVPEVPVGAAASDIILADLDGDGKKEIVVTHHLSGTILVVRSDERGAVTAGLPFQVTTSLPSLVLPTNVPQAVGHAIVRSEVGAFGVAAADFNGDGIQDLVAGDQRANRFVLLPGDGSGGFLNPVPFATASAPTAVRVADFDGDHNSDLAILDQKPDGTFQVEIFLSDGHGGFTWKSSIDAGNTPVDLAVVPDINGDPSRPNVLDLAVGNAFGDILVLLGNGDGTFRPAQPPEPDLVKGKIALAAANLTGKPGETDFILADRDGSNLTVQYGRQGRQLSLASANLVKRPGAVAIAEFNGIPYLVVANSGGNDVLVYGLGNGQFDPRPSAFAVGTDPVSVTIADLNGDGIPDVVAADEGSNDVAVLLGQNQGGNWSLMPGLRLKTGAGPVAVAVADLTGPQGVPDGIKDLVVTDSRSNDVRVMAGVGLGFFADGAAQPVPTGTDPQETLVGNFGGCSGMVTVNAGSNDLTVTSDCGGEAMTSTIATGGKEPVAAALGDFRHDGTTDLLVLNYEDGKFGLLARDANGFALEDVFSLPGVPHPSDVAVSSSGDVYVTAAGIASAVLVTLPAAAPAPEVPPPLLPSLGSVPGLAPGEEIPSTTSASARLLSVIAGDVSETEASNSFRGGDEDQDEEPPRREEPMKWMGPDNPAPFRVVQAPADIRSDLFPDSFTDSEPAPPGRTTVLSGEASGKTAQPEVGPSDLSRSNGQPLPCMPLPAAVLLGPVEDAETPPPHHSGMLWAAIGGRWTSSNVDRPDAAGSAKEWEEAENRGAAWSCLGILTVYWIGWHTHRPAGRKQLFARLRNR
jgi:hypothetical protein